MPTLPAAVLEQYRRFSLYNSPYVAHGRGRAIDLYPWHHEEDAVPSPVAGEVLDCRRVTAPPRSYAEEHDHLILVDTGDYVARTLHVDPAVEPGDRVAVGDVLGRTVRAGFFAPWVDDHVHLGFREHGTDYRRASGSLPLEVAVDPEGLAWDGRGRVREAGETYVVLDAPAHPAPGGDRWVGLADADGHALDGGLVHYEGGGRYGPSGPVDLLGQRVGTADGRHVAWESVAVLANGEPVTGLSLFVARDEAFGAKIVCPDHELAVGDPVEVRLDPTDDPVRLG
jgi:hypothetical protein